MVFRQEWWAMPTIPALQMLKQDCCELKGSLGYKVGATPARYYIAKLKETFNGFTVQSVTEFV